MFSKIKGKFSSLPIAYKVTIWYTLLMVFSFALVVLFASRFMEAMDISQAQLTLQSQVDEAAHKPHKVKGYDDGVYLVVYQEGQQLRGYLPPGLSLDNKPRFGQGPQKVVQNGKEYRYYDVPSRDTKHGEASVWVRGAIAIDPIMNRSVLSLVALLLAMPIFIVLASIGGYKIVKRAFQPVASISATAKEISATSDLTRRVELNPGEDEIHKMAEAFNEMLAGVEASVEREKQFSADVSHELRTPVAVIMSESEYGKKYIKTVEEAQESFATIFAQTKNMSVLINQLLELSRLNKGGSVKLSEVNYSSLVQEVVEDYQQLLEERGLLLETKIDEEITVWGQENLLRRVVSNYLDNAVKFTATTIRVSLCSKQGHTILAVQDDGAGIAPADLTKIWQRFYQTDASRNKEGNQGLGLGLALVETIAGLHKGRAYATSSVGKGTTFFLEI